MRWLLLRALIVFAVLLAELSAATFGTVVPVVGGVVDMVLDARRQRLYIVNVPDQIQVYSIPQRRFLTPIRTDSLPLSAAMSRDGSVLYVTAYNASSLNVIDLERLEVTRRVSLPARPEGVAVGADGKVLISTIGTGANNAQNTLLVYDPSPGALNSIAALTIAPAAPTPPQLPPPQGRVFLANRSQMMATEDGSFIIGMNIPTTNASNRVMFVYEAASNTVLRSRVVTGASSVLAIHPNGRTFMAGLTLFDTQTLEVIAQQNLANAPYAVPPNTNFNLQQNQGGSVFAPDGTVLFSAFNVAPVIQPAARPNVSQMMVSDPENLLIRAGLQLPENLAGGMVITPDGGTIFAASESGFVILPINQIQQSPLLIPETSYVSLANDQCGVTSDFRAGRVTVRNDGRGNLGPVTATLIQTTPTNVGGLGGAGGQGGGTPGGSVVVVVPPTTPGAGAGAGTLPGGTLPGFPGITLPGQGGAANQQANSILATAPTQRSVPAQDGRAAAFEFGFNTVNARSPGTALPTHDFVLTSPNMVNIPPRVRVYQNNRDAEARGEIVPIDVAVSANEALTDIVYDGQRQRVYIANSGMNRVEVYDTASKKLLSPIRVGQLPRSMALSLDNQFLYVANSGSESISVIDLQTGQLSGKIRYPAIPFNANFTVITPQAIAMTTRGLLVMMNNGTLWRQVGDELVPRTQSALIGTTTITAPRSMAATPTGEYALVMGGNGFVYLYDALQDDFVQARQIFTGTGLNGYFGALAAGPRAQYFLANNSVLNQSLTVTSAAQTTATGAVRPGQTPATIPQPIPAVAPVGATTFLRFTTPILAANTTIATEPAALELVDVNSGQVTRRLNTLEGPLSTVVGNARVGVQSRTMVVDNNAANAYILTATGLSIIPLDAIPAVDRPVINPNGTVSLASYLPQISQGGLISIFGRNLAQQAAATGAPLPRSLGGVCVTLNNTPLPLLMTSPTQINAQIPPELAAGRYSMIVRAFSRNLASATQQITVAKYAPAVLVDSANKQAAVYDEEGRYITPTNPTTRDRRVKIYAVGLGPTKGPRVLGGDAAPENAVTDPLTVFFGDPRYSQADMAVEYSRLLPGFIGIYEIQVYVPWDRLRGKELLVTLRIGGISSPSTGPAVPTIAVE